MNPLELNSQRVVQQYQDLQPVTTEEDPLQNQQTDIADIDFSTLSSNSDYSSDEEESNDESPIDYNSLLRNMRPITFGESPLQSQHNDIDVKTPTAPDFNSSLDQVYSSGEIVGNNQRIFEPKTPSAPEISITRSPEEQVAFLTDTISDPLPKLIPFFTGRKSELKQLEKEFQEKGVVIASPITGPGGIGKTQLVLQLIKQLQQQADYDLF